MLARDLSSFNLVTASSLVSGRWAQARAMSADASVTQRLLVLVGLHGSGKTRLADALSQNGWAVVKEVCLCLRALTCHLYAIIQQASRWPFVLPWHLHTV